MLKTEANVVAADLLHDLLLIAYQGRLYVQPTPDAEPVAVFDAQEVQQALTAEGENRQTLAAALVAIRLGHAARLPAPACACLRRQAGRQAASAALGPWRRPTRCWPPPRRGQARLADAELRNATPIRRSCSCPD